MSAIKRLCRYYVKPQKHLEVSGFFTKISSILDQASLDRGLVVSLVLAGRPLFLRYIISLILAFAVEVSQLYHAPWIDSIRNTTLGGLVLGFGFLWSDLVCYLVGIAAGALIELTMRRWRGMRESHLVS